MKVRIANVDDNNTDLIISGSGGGTMAVKPLSFGKRISRDYMEIEIGANELLILRPRGAKDPDGVEIKTPV